MDKDAAKHRAIRPLTSRPAVTVAVCFMAGIGAHSVLPQHPLWLIGIISACMIAAIIGWRWHYFSSAALGMGILVAGAGLAQIQSDYFPANHISMFTTDDPQLMQLELEIIQPPRVIASDEKLARPLPPRQATLGEIVKVMAGSDWQKASGTLLVHIAQVHPGLALGQRVRVTGMLQRPAAAMNPGQFDGAEYYRQQRILASIHIRRAENIRIVSNDSPGWLDRLRGTVREKLSMGFSQAASLDHALLRALLVGDSDPELREIQDQFRRTGTSHHLSISGLHIAVLGGFVYYLCRLLRLAPRITAWGVIWFVILYGAVAVSSPPVVRSVLLCVSIGFGVIQRRWVDSVQLLALSVLAMLIYQPGDLFNAGFQLSFGTVLGLMLLTEPLVEFFNNLENEHDRMARQIVPPQGIRAFLFRRRQSFITSLAAGLVAWLVSAPLIAFHFGQINPWAIPASIILAIPVFCGLIGGLLKIVLTFCCPWLAGIWATGAAWPMVAMRHMVDWLDRLPWSDWPIPSPPVWMLGIYYAMLCLPLIPRLRSRPIAWAGPAGAGVMVLSIPMLTGIFGNAEPIQLRMTALSVGAGSCNVIELPNHHAVLIDCGSTDENLYRNCLQPFLRLRRIHKIEAIFLTHANADHFSAAEELVQAYDVSKVFVDPLFVASNTTNSSAHRLLQKLQNEGITPLPLHVNQCIPFDEENAIEIIWPPLDPQISENDASLVLRLTSAGRSILFTGDIQASAEKQLLHSPSRLKSDVLIAPHHGSAETTTAEFVRAIDPQWIISSNDRTLSNKQRTFDQIIGSRPLYRTHRYGAITVTITPSGKLKLDTFRPGTK